jgi:uncharacterized coiled-coil protein SlyX
MTSDGCAILGAEHAVPCQIFKRFEKEQALRWKDSEAKWNIQKQRNDHQDALLRRWGATLDGMQANLAEQGRATASFEGLLVAQQREAEKTTELLRELADGLKQTNDRAVQNHQALMTSMTSAFGVSTHATERADKAHAEAEEAAREAQMAATRARDAAEEARMIARDRSALTRGALLAWGVGIAGAGAAIAAAINLYGWKTMRALGDWLIGSMTP